MLDPGGAECRTITEEMFGCLAFSVAQPASTSLAAADFVPPVVGVRMMAAPEPG